MADFKRPKTSFDPDRPVIRSHREAMKTTQLAYMADMLLELKDMAAAEGHSTLAGLLALAHMEALEKSRS